MEFDRIKETREELVAKGFLRDSGRRRNGQIVWEITEAGKAYVEAAIAEDRPKH
jgi:DNA-binding PadR family transcriptional regulator